MSSPDSSSKKPFFSGITRDLCVFAMGNFTGAFGYHTYLNQTNQLRTEAEVEAIEKRLQQQAGATKATT
jgi:hypothetical protein